MAAGGIGGSKITALVRTEFNRIIGNPGVKTTNALIDQLQFRDAPTPDFYTDAATTLPALTCTFEPDTARPGKEKGIIGRDPVIQIGGGSYGTIFLGNSGKAYKRTVKKASQDPEDFHKELFMEPFIQTLLQNDATYGRNIARIIRVYRDAGAIAGTSRVRGAVSATGAKTTAPMHESNYTYYYEMEPIAYTIDRYIANFPPNTFIDKLRDIGAILNYFKTNYGFYHCDLHGNNIMFTDTGEIKIIDFGLSCITDAGTVYSVAAKVCHSWDLLIYTTWLRQDNILPAFNPLFDKLLSHNGNNLYNIVEASAECKTDGVNPDGSPYKVVWWSMYNWEMDDPISGPRGVWTAADTETDAGLGRGSRPLIDFFMKYLKYNFGPAAFSDYWRRVSNALAAGRTGIALATPLERELAAVALAAPIPMVMGAPPPTAATAATGLAAPTPMVMGAPPPAAATAMTTKSGCCKGGLCGLCGGRFLRKSVAKRYLRKSMSKRLRKNTFKKSMSKRLRKRANKTRRSN
jgi:hypothetical protein